jgi:hypothetical protein
MDRQRIFKAIRLLILLASLVGLISCTLPMPSDETAVAEARPRAWIDFPRDGASVPVEATVIVVSHAYAEDGVTEVLLSVNSTAYRRDPPTAVSDSLVEVRQEWVPQEPGLHTLEVRTYDRAGAFSGSDSITIQVIGEATSEATGSPTDLPPSTNVPTDAPEATGTPVSTQLPTDLPTPTWPPVPTQPPTDVPPPTWTPTPFPPPQVSFWVDDGTITAGECTTLHWDVEYATAVFLNGGGVIGHGTQKICPASTTTYVLHVEAPGGNADRSVVVTVSTPADTTPPPVPTPYVPANSLVIDPCPASRKQTLAWLPVNDPSGVVYYIKLEQQEMASTWRVVHDWKAVSGKQVEADVTCGGIYRWAVRAQDGAGNISAWSEWFTFSITLG